MSEETSDYSYLLDVLKLAEAGEEKEGQEKLNVVFKGDFTVNSSISNINSNFTNLLSRDSSYNLSVLSDGQSIESSFLEGSLDKNLPEVDVFISHSDLPDIKIPDNGKWVLWQNCSVGSIPIDWLEPIVDYLDQLWVSNSYEKDNYIAAKVPADKIKVVNTAVDSLYFNPNITDDFSIDTKKTKKILFKGDLSWESGFDILLSAFTKEFVQEEDICLVLATEINKINPQMKSLIQSYQNSESFPEIVFLDIKNNDDDYSALYSFCDFLAYPYRVDSYGLNLLESMACGTPAITIDKGLSNDYCDHENSLLVDSEKVYQKDKLINGLLTRNYPFWLEVNETRLRVKLRDAYDMSSSDYLEMSKVASKRIIDNFTWVKQNDFIKNLLVDLKSEKITKRESFNDLNIQILNSLEHLQNKDFDKSYDLLTSISKDINDPRVYFYLANLLMNKNDFTGALSYTFKAYKKMTQNLDDLYNLIGILLYKLNYFSLAKKLFQATLSLSPNFQGAKESLRAINNLTDEQISEPSVDLNDNLKVDLDFILSDIDLIELPTLSVCILAKNEEKSIAKTIRSVKKVADEIIVLDTGSEDKTTEIAELEGATVYHGTWNNSFADARNQLLKYATKDWVFMIDADELLVDKSVESLKQTLLACNPEKVFSPKITNLLGDADQEVISHYVTRIFKNNSNLKFIREIHEYPVKSDGTLFSSDNLPNIELMHYGYNPNAMKDKGKVSRNKELLESMAEKEPDNPLNMYYLGVTYKDENDDEKVVKSLEKAIELCEKDNSEKYNHILHISILTLLDTFITNDQTKKAENLINLYSGDLESRPDFWLLYGSFSLKLGNYQKAIELQHKALRLRGKEVYPMVDVGSVTWKPLAIIAEANLNLKENAKAIMYYKKAIKESPENLALYIGLVNIYNGLDDLDNLEKVLRDILNLCKPILSIEVIKKVSSIYLEANNLSKLYKLLEGFRVEILKNVNLSDNDNKTIKTFLIEIYNEIIAKDSTFIACNYSIACCYNDLKQYDESSNYFQMVIDEDDLDVDSLHNLGSIAYTNGDLDKANKIYLEVLEIDEFHSETYLSLIKLELKKDNIEKAREYIKELQDIDPDNDDLIKIELEIADKSGDKKLASDMYAAMLFNYNL